MDDWEWPREFWHLPPPWEAGADPQEADPDDDGEDEEFYSLANWEEPEPSGDFLSLEELEDREEEAMWDEEFDFDDPTHLYFLLDYYEYLREVRDQEPEDLEDDES